MAQEVENCMIDSKNPGSDLLGLLCTKKSKRFGTANRRPNLDRNPNSKGICSAALVAKSQYDPVPEIGATCICCIKSPRLLSHFGIP